MRRLIAIATLLMLVIPAAAVAAAKQGHHPRFVTKVLPVAPTSGAKVNQDAEPGIGVDGDGTFWIASDITPYAADDQRKDPVGLLTGGDVWKSTDGGKSYQWVANPFYALAEESFGLAGEDTDIAVATEKNPQGFYNIYVGSLWIGATELAVSQDGGKTWSVNPLGGLPGQDRPFMAASGPCSVYVSYHWLPDYNTIVSRYDVCGATGLVPGATGSALDPVESTELFLGGAVPGLSNRLGKLAVDNSKSSKFHGSVYQPMDACPDDLSDPTGPEVALLDCPTSTEIVVGISRDGGQTFHNRVVAKTGSKTVYIWPVTMAVDDAGNVYCAWFDHGKSFINVSRDGGETWSKSVRINSGGSAVYPTVAAGKAGKVFVAWYGSPRKGDSNNVKIMRKPNTDPAAPWYLYTARSDDFGRTFHDETRASGVIHTGTLCTFGGGCGVYPGDRNLLDDFGVAINPTTGLASVAFTNDQPGGKSERVHTDFATELRS